MKSLTGLVLGIFAMTVAAGCSSTKITETHPMYGKEKLPKPERIYVYPFAANQADLPAWSSAAKQMRARQPLLRDSK